MLDYRYPDFNFAAPLELATRIGRNEPPSQPYRTAFMRDRDRVLYCSAFRRLAGKTQIYLAGKDDHQRNRLTHTLEVSQIARTISQALGLNCDLTEAIALGHDLGHTPFGHAGEKVLHEIMVPQSPINIKKSPMNDLEFLKSDMVNQNIFGFKHNIQSIRLAASLESNYGKNGLNLTNYTLWGILHHSGLEYKKESITSEFLVPSYKSQFESCMMLQGENCNKEAWSFEAFVVAQADEIAQWHHDLEDALRGNAMTSSDVCQTIQRNLGEIMDSDGKKTLDTLKSRKQINRKYIADLSRVVVNTLVNRLVECSMYNLSLLWNTFVRGDDRLSFFKEMVWNDPDISSAIGFKKKNEKNDSIDSFQKEYPSVIKEKIHHSREVERMNAKGQYVIKKLFQAYYSHPQQLPDNIIVQYMVDVGQYADLTTAATVSIGLVRTKFEKIISNSDIFTYDKKVALMRKICDHIAGMTDHYAIEEYKSLYN